MSARILIIDDDDALCMMLKALVQSWGYHVYGASSGEDGVRIIQEEPVDLVLTDLKMPGMDGEAVLQKVRETHPTVPVIIMTAHGSVKSAVSAMSKGALEYILKPIDNDELKVTLERAFELSDLRRENEFLRAEVRQPGSLMIAESPAMEQATRLMLRVAQSDTTVLITGETGTGKEVAAKYIHVNSARSSKPFIAFNCAALNANLLESELFGHEKGAFTGASATRRGRFELADGGTILLDEIGEVPLEFQVKLLRVLQERQFERVGGTNPIKVDIRILASTNRNLEEEVENGRFREDLLYRLKVVPVHIPPLRERPEDIQPLAELFVRQYAAQYGVSVVGLSEDGLAYVKGREWKGNVRELQHAIERAVVLSSGGRLTAGDFQLLSEGSSGSRDDGDRTLQAHIDRQTVKYIIQVLNSTDWQRQKAADILGMDRATLYRLMKKHDIEVVAGRK